MSLNTPSRAKQPPFDPKELDRPHRITYAIVRKLGKPMGIEAEPLCARPGVLLRAHFLISDLVDAVLCEKGPTRMSASVALKKIEAKTPYDVKLMIQQVLENAFIER